jgi:hypothetical protein
MGSMTRRAAAPRSRRQAVSSFNASAGFGQAAGVHIAQAAVASADQGTIVFSFQQVAGRGAPTLRQVKPPSLSPAKPPSPAPASTPYRSPRKAPPASSLPPLPANTIPCTSAKPPRLAPAKPPMPSPAPPVNPPAVVPPVSAPVAKQNGSCGKVFDVRAGVRGVGQRVAR